MFQGPILYKWYGLLQTRIVFKNPALSAFGRMAADQLIFAPAFLFVFFWINGGLQGLPPNDIKSNITKNYPDVLIANYKVFSVGFWILIILTMFNCLGLSACTKKTFKNDIIFWNDIFYSWIVMASCSNGELLGCSIVSKSSSCSNCCTCLEYVFGLENKSISARFTWKGICDQARKLIRGFSFNS